MPRDPIFVVEGGGRENGNGNPGPVFSQKFSYVSRLERKKEKKIRKFYESLSQDRYFGGGGGGRAEEEEEDGKKECFFLFLFRLDLVHVDLLVVIASIPIFVKLDIIVYPFVSVPV